MAEGAYGVDINGNCTFVNRSFLRILGFENADEIIGKHIHELIHHSHADGRLYPATECRMYNAYRLNQGIHVTDEVFWRKDGTAIPVEYWSQPILVEEVMQGAIATFVDITERKQVMAKLRESEERFRQMFERHSAVMLLIEPSSGFIVDANPAAADFYGYPLSNLRGMSIDSISALGDDVKAHDPRAAIVQERNYCVFEHWLANGERRTVEVYSSPLSFKNKSLLFSIVHDITERKLAEAQIRNLAFYDALTQLPNRRLLNDRLDQAIATNKRNGLTAALMFLDLDNFKPLNDICGHEVGDQLLVEAARRINSCIRETDTAARFGGDEFVVMLGDLDADAAESAVQAGEVAEKMRAALSEPYLLTVAHDGNVDGTVEHHCSASIGVVVFNHPAIREEVLKWADTAMYAAKSGGRNRIVVEQHCAAGASIAQPDVPVLRLTWRAAYACGEPTIDQEHRKLFELANALIESAFTRAQHPEKFDANLGKLLAHVVQHFADEEAILARNHYSELADHARAHKMLVERALHLRDAIAAGGVSIGELVDFLANEVVAEHMLKIDHRFYSLFDKQEPAQSTDAKRE